MKDLCDVRVRVRERTQYLNCLRSSGVWEATLNRLFTCEPSCRRRATPDWKEGEEGREGGKEGEEQVHLKCERALLTSDIIDINKQRISLTLLEQPLKDE